MGARRSEATYLVGAVPVRLVSEGTGVALALAAAVDLHRPALGGVLIAVLTAPSVIAAPLIGALLDAVRSPRRAMLVAAVVLAAALAVVAFLDVVPLPVVLVALVVAGCVLPMFMGGLSAFVGEVMPGDVARGFTVDALAYNLAGIGGPAIVAAMSALLSPTGALLALAVVALAGGLVLQTLPITGRGGSLHPAAVLGGIAAASRHFAGHGPLARVIVSGAVVQLSGGALPVIAVLLATQRAGDAGAAAWLVTAFAVGGVTGALAIAAPAVAAQLERVPTKAVMAGGFATTGLFLLAAAFAPNLPITLVLLGLAGLPDAPAVAAMLRLRQQESPQEVRAQIFVVGAGLRVAAAAVGAAVVAGLTGLNPVLLTALAAVPWVAATPILFLRSRRPPRR